MKRIFALILAVLLLFSGCSASNDPSSEWVYGQLPAGGGGFVSGLIATNEEGLYYARTDVGGAYRYNRETGRWECLTLWVGEDEKGYLGVDGLAVDPENAGIIYMACAIEYFDGGRSVVMKSTDYGGFNSFISGDMNVYGRCYMGTVGMGIVYCDKVDKE